MQFCTCVILIGLLSSAAGVPTVGMYHLLWEVETGKQAEEEDQV